MLTIWLLSWLVVLDRHSWEHTKPSGIESEYLFVKFGPERLSFRSNPPCGVIVCTVTNLQRYLARPVHIHYDEPAALSKDPFCILGETVEWSLSWYLLEHSDIHNLHPFFSAVRSSLCILHKNHIILESDANNRLKGLAGLKVERSTKGRIENYTVLQYYERLWGRNPGKK